MNERKQEKKTNKNELKKKKMKDKIEWKKTVSRKVNERKQKQTNK